MAKTNQLAQDNLEARAEALELTVVRRAKILAVNVKQRGGIMKYKACLQIAAEEFCENWEYSIDEFATSEFENCTFTLLSYNPHDEND